MFFTIFCDTDVAYVWSTKHLLNTNLSVVSMYNLYIQTSTP